MTKKLFTVLIVVLALLISFSLVIAAKKAPFRGTPERYVKPTIAQKQSATPLPTSSLAEPLTPLSLPMGDLPADRVIGDFSAGEENSRLADLPQSVGDTLTVLPPKVAALTVIATCAAIVTIVWGLYELNSWMTDNYVVGSVGQDPVTCECAPEGSWTRDDDGWASASVDINLLEFGAPPCGMAWVVGWADDVWGDEGVNDCWVRGGSIAYGSLCPPTIEDTVRHSGRAKADNFEAVTPMLPGLSEDTLVITRTVEIDSLMIIVPEVTSDDSASGGAGVQALLDIDGALDTILSCSAVASHDGSVSITGDIPPEAFDFIGYDPERGYVVQLFDYIFEDTLVFSPDAIPESLTTTVIAEIIGCSSAGPTGPVGCCDLPAGGCDMMTEADCITAGGTWYASPYECIDDVCQIPPPDECYMFQGSGLPQSYWSGWGEGDGVAKYYDPEEHCLAPVYPVRIDAVDVALYDYPGAGTVDVEVAIYIECAEPCDGPGTEIYRSETFTVTTFYPSVATITLPDLICIYEPFFVAIHYVNVTGQVPSVLFDDGSVPYDTCHAWMWYESAGYSPPWWEWSDFWAAPPPGTPMIYVSGYTESPACDIPPCDTTLDMLPGATYFYYYWKQPPLEEFINMRFEMPADHGGRLEYFNVAFYEAGSDGTPDPDFYVWLSDGLYPLDNNAPYQAVADFHMTYDDIVWYPGWTTIQAYAHNLIFDPAEMFHIGVSHAFEPGDTLPHLSDDGYFESDRASAWDGGAWISYYPYEFGIDAYICPIPWQPTFVMQCAPALGYATPGDPPANVYQVELTPILGYAENVTLSLLSVDPPANISATFTPNGLPPPYIADVAITAQPGVSYDDYTLTFEAVADDGQARTCDVTLRVQPPFDEEIVEFFHGFQRTSNFGAIGNDAGDNFVWYGTNYLFDGSIISAVPGDPHSAHMALDVYDCEHVGFIPTQHLVKTYDPWCPGSPYEEYYGRIAYSNFYTEEDVISCEYDSFFVIGLKDVDCSDFSIKIKIYYNPTPTPIDTLFTGVFEDWDVGDYSANWVETDPDHNLMWIYDVADPAIVFGIMKAPFYDDPLWSMVAVHNPSLVYPNAGFCSEWGRDSLYYYMTTQHIIPNEHWSPDPDDRSILIGDYPFSLNPGEKHIEIWIDFGRNLNDGLTWEQWWHKILRYVGFYRGDVNASDTLELPALDVSDLIYLVNYLYKGGPTPQPFPDQGDVDGQPIPKDIECPKNNVNAGDVVYLLNYVWKGGPPPVDYVRFIPQYWSRPSLFTNPNW